MTEQQTYLPRPYEVWDSKVGWAEIACEDCAVKFATANNLVWRGNTSSHSFTLDAEEKGVGASCIASYALGDADYPYACCGTYLDTNITEHGFAYMEEVGFPEWVMALYRGLK